MVEEYKVRSGFKCNPWAIKKLSGLQLCAFICPRHADPSAATILASRCWLLIQMYSPCLSAPGVGAPSDTAVRVYSLVFMSLNKSFWPPSCFGLLAAPDTEAMNRPLVSTKGTRVKAFTPCTPLTAVFVFRSFRWSVSWPTTLTPTEIAQQLFEKLGYSRIYGSRMMNSNDFGDFLTFPLCHEVDICPFEWIISNFGWILTEFGIDWCPPQKNVSNFSYIFIFHPSSQTLNVLNTLAKYLQS